jgi:hypothetical protein
MLAVDGRGGACVQAIDKTGALYSPCTVYRLCGQQKSLRNVANIPTPENRHSPFRLHAVIPSRNHIVLIFHQRSAPPSPERLRVGSTSKPVQLISTWLRILTPTMAQPTLMRATSMAIHMKSTTGQAPSWAAKCPSWKGGTGRNERSLWALAGMS